MTYNWQAILGGLAGGVLAALVAAYATTQVLPEASGWYAVTDLVWAGIIVAAGGVLGVVLGWFVNTRHGTGLGGIAAITALLGALGGSGAWARASSDAYDMLPFLTGVILMLGGILILLAAVCGLSAALLRLQSVPADPSGRLAEPDRL